MISRKWIIEYLSGCKGDMLTYHLNGITVDLDPIYNRTSSLFYNRIGTGNSLIYPVELFEKYLETAQEKNILFSNSHQLNFSYQTKYTNLLEKYNIGIKKIVFSQEFYKTIHIECVIKTLNRLPLSCPVTNILKKKKLKFTDTNKAEILHQLLDRPVQYPIFDVYNKNIKTLKNKNLLDYKSLYVTFDSDDPDINENIKWDDFKKLVEKSWIAEKIELYGETWNLRDYGYRKF
jgi:hypothetical protein